MHKGINKITMEENRKQYLPVNWTDGMKMNKTHLVAERNALQQMAVQAAGSNITGINYGLLPPVAETQAPFKIFIGTDNQQQVQIRLASCRAVTPPAAQ